MIRRRETREDVFTRRALIMAGGQLGLFGLLVGRLQYLQVNQSALYVTLAEDNRVNFEPLPVARGRILDRYGDELAGNDQNFLVTMMPEQAGDIAEVLSRLRHIVPMSDRAYGQTLKRLKTNPKFMPITIADNISWEQFSRVNLEAPFLPGVNAVVGQKRLYPLGPQSAHIVGYVGSQSSRNGRPVSYEFEGRAGLERVLDSTLQGEAGNRRVEVNAIGRVVRELERREGVVGADAKLTVDGEIQAIAFNALGNHSGSVVVMDAETGEVYALASTPAFDPNQISVGVDEKTWSQLISDEKKPLLNKPVSGQYAPGSVFKMIVALAALDAGVVTSDHKVDCTGVYEFGGQKFHCWEKKGHGVLDMVNSIAHSCDIYFYDLALRTGIDAIGRMAKKFGYGVKTGIEISGEKSGVMPSRDWKRANYDAAWQPGETVITGIGQGYVLSTPLQLATMTARIASGKANVKPHILQHGASQDKGEGHSEEDVQIDVDTGLDIKPEHLEVIRKAMDMVVNSSGGTAFGSRILVNGLRMAGKTGTVQVRRIHEEERETGVLKNSELPWHLRDHAIFVGYAPLDKPKYVISSVIEHGGSGSSVAAPIVSKVMTRILQIDPHSKQTPERVS